MWIFEEIEWFGESIGPLSLKRFKSRHLDVSTGLFIDNVGWPVIAPRDSIVPTVGSMEMIAMRKVHSRPLRAVLSFLAGLLIVKVTLVVVLNYSNYHPPRFDSDFLRGREHYFSGPYRWAFYAHLLSSPISLLLGMILVSELFRLRFPRWHRLLGRIQVALVLFLVAPSGLWMARYAAAGPVAAVGLAALAVATGTCVALGWRSAMKRRFAEHQRWMWRVFLLLCSAVVLRMIGGLATVIGTTAAWVDPLATWMSWLVPLAVFELIQWGNRRVIRPSLKSSRGLDPDSAISSRIRQPDRRVPRWK